MDSSQQVYAGTRYNGTVAFLAVAFVFSPAVLILSRPFGNTSLFLAVGCSALCLLLAWANWRRHSTLTIPSIFPDPGAELVPLSVRIADRLEAATSK